APPMPIGAPPKPPPPPPRRSSISARDPPGVQRMTSVQRTTRARRPVFFQPAPGSNSGERSSPMRIRAALMLTLFFFACAKQESSPVLAPSAPVPVADGRTHNKQAGLNSLGYVGNQPASVADQELSAPEMNTEEYGRFEENPF